jgi:protein O-mannosyl-transferase
MNKNTKKTTPVSKVARNHSDIFSHPYLHYSFLIAGSFLLYGWTITFDYNLDDELVLSNLSWADNTLQGFITIFKSWYAGGDYRPVTVLSFWLERLLFKTSTPAVSHFFNVLIFGILLTGIYKLILVSKFRLDEKNLISLALLSSFLFLIHPNHVSVVANIKSRDNLLSMLFGLMAAIQLIQYFDLKKKKLILYFIMFITLALLSKRDSYAFFFYPLLVVLFFRDYNRKILMRYALITIGVMIITSILNSFMSSQLDSRFNLASIRLEETPLAVDHTFGSKLSLTLTSFIYYVKFLIIPFGYHFYFGYNQIPVTPVLAPLNILSITVIAGLFSLCVFYFNKNRIYLFCLIFYGIAIGYALNFITPVSGILMDRYNFIASMSFCIAIASIFTDYFNNDWKILMKNKLLLAVVLIYTGFTIYRTSAWKDRYTLFDRDLKYLTNSVNANRIAGGTYISEALEEELKPNFNKPLADSFINKGERYILNAISIYDKSAQVWEHLGLCELYRKNYDSAITIFRKCYALDTTYLSGINYLGFSFWNANQLDSAEYYFNYVIKREPFYGYSANNLLNLYIRSNRIYQADSIAETMFLRYPNDAGLIKKRNEINAVLNQRFQQ